MAHSCQGGSISHTLTYLKAHGAMSRTDYPYQGRKGPCKYDAQKAQRVAEEDLVQLFARHGDIKAI